MGTFNDLSGSGQPLSPELADKKKNVERLGYNVRNFAGKWFVTPPKGVEFLKLRAPEHLAYFELKPGSFSSTEAWEKFWNDLPKDRKYCWKIPYTDKKKFYRVDPDAKAQWERFLEASDNFFEVLFRTPESLNAYEGDEENGHYIDFDEYLFEVIDCQMGMSSVDLYDGRHPDYHDSVYAVRWDGDFPTMTLNGVEIESANMVELEGFHRLGSSDYMAAVDELHAYDAKKLSLRLMPQNHPDIILSSSDELCGDTEVAVSSMLKACGKHYRGGARITTFSRRRWI